MHRTSPLLVAVVLATPCMAANAASFNRQMPIGAAERVFVSNLAGSVTITTWDRHEVDVRGELGDGVDHVDVERGRGGVEIRVQLRHNTRRGNGQAHLQIRVPADVRLEATTVSASLFITGVQGRARLKSVSGAIRSEMPGNDLEATSVSGQIEIAGGNMRSRLRLSTVSGGVAVSQSAGDVEARTTSGSLIIALADAGRVRLSTVSGGIRVTGALAERGSVEANSVSGGMRIAAQGRGFRYEASSYSGRVSSCFEGGEYERSPRGSTLEGVRGTTASGLVVAKSHSGAVEICDR